MHVADGDGESSAHSSTDDLKENSERMTLGSQPRLNNHLETMTTDSKLYGLAEQTEACVWDNIKLTHINAKLIEYAKNQAVELTLMAAKQPDSQQSISDLQSEVTGLRKKNDQLTELVNNERSELFDTIRSRQDEMHDTITQLKMEIRS